MKIKFYIFWLIYCREHSSRQDEVVCLHYDQSQSQQRCLHLRPISLSPNRFDLSLQHREEYHPTVTNNLMEILRILASTNHSFRLGNDATDSQFTRVFALR